MKKFLSLALAVLLVIQLAALSACSTGKSTKAPEQLPAGSKAQSPVTPAEKVKFSATFLANEWHGDPNQMEVFKKLAEKANVEVQWQVFPAATWNDKKNLLLASNSNLPDVFYMNAVNQTDVVKYASQGLFMQLDSLIDKNCPTLKAVFEKMPQYKRVCVNPDDGKIYYVARAAERSVQYTQSTIFFYKPWLDKLGLQVPTTTDEFYNVLKAFKTRDPNSNGKADEIPFTFTMNKADFMYSDLFGSFGYVDTFYGIPHFIMDENKKVVYVANQPEYKDAITFYHKFFKEGLMDKEGFTTSDTKIMNSKGKSEPPILGSFACFDPSFVVSQDRVKDFVPMAPLKGPKGKQVWTNFETSNGNINGTQFVLAKSAKNQDAIMRWLDAHFDPTLSIELFLGPVGTTLQKTPSGMLDYVPTPQGMSYSEFRYKNAPVHVPCVIPGSSWGKDIAVMAEDVFKLDIAKKYYVPYSTQSSLFTLSNMQETKFLQTKGKDIDDYVQKMQIKWLLEGGIENEWSDYLKKLDSMGLPEYIEMVEGMQQRLSTKK